MSGGEGIWICHASFRLLCPQGSQASWFMSRAMGIYRLTVRSDLLLSLSVAPLGWPSVQAVSLGVFTTFSGSAASAKPLYQVCLLPVCIPGDTLGILISLAVVLFPPAFGVVWVALGHVYQVASSWQGCGPTLLGYSHGYIVGLLVSIPSSVFSPSLSHLILGVLYCWCSCTLGWSLVSVHLCGDPTGLVVSIVIIRDWAPQCFHSPGTTAGLLLITASWLAAIRFLVNAVSILVSLFLLGSWWRLPFAAVCGSYCLSA